MGFKRMLLDDDMRIIYSHSVREYPFECCGVVSRSGAGLNMVHMCVNIQGDLHQRDPSAYPRDSRMAYCIDPKEFAGIERELKQSNGAIIGLYHSHPDHDAYFSETDRKMALLFGEPVFPDAEYIVVSVYRGEVKGGKSFQWDGNSREFKEKRVFNRLP